MKCPECNDTRVYYGLGTAPPEPCRACQPPSFYPVGHVPSASGSRNERCFNVAWYMARKGVEEDIAHCTVAQWRDQHAQGLPDAEVEQCVKSAYRIDRAHRDLQVTQAEPQEVTGPAHASDARTPNCVMERLVVTGVVDGVTTGKYDGDDGITIIDGKGRKFQASIDEWCEAMQARVDKIADQIRQDVAQRRWATAFKAATHDHTKALVELTREPAAHELATRQLPPIKVELPIRGFRSSDEHRRFVGHLTAEVLKALAAIPKVNYSGSVKSDTCPKSQPITDAELMKLIDQAVKSGQTLDALIKERTLANGGTPPIITLHTI